MKNIEQKENTMKTQNQIFWEKQDSDAYARGMRFRSGHECGGNAYHITRAAAEAAAKRKARAACPGNPPCWHVVEILA